MAAGGLAAFDATDSADAQSSSSLQAQINQLKTENTATDTATPGYYPGGADPDKYAKVQIRNANAEQRGRSHLRDGQARQRPT